MVKSIKEVARCVAEKYPKSAFGEEVARGHIDMDDEEWLTEMLSEFFSYDILGLCGCGNPEDTWEVIRRVLRIRSLCRKRFVLDAWFELEACEEV